MVIIFNNKIKTITNFFKIIIIEQNDMDDLDVELDDEVVSNINLSRVYELNGILNLLVEKSKINIKAFLFYAFKLEEKNGTKVHNKDRRYAIFSTIFINKSLLTKIKITFRESKAYELEGLNLKYMDLVKINSAELKKDSNDVERQYYWGNITYQLEVNNASTYKKYR